MEICESCKEYGLNFKRYYEPVDFIEGKLSSKIWIVGLNPNPKSNHEDLRQKSELEDFFKTIHTDSKMCSKKYSYFKDFETISEELYQLIGAENGVAHTDIVKCSSNKFPPEGVDGTGKKNIINYCSAYLRKQIETHKPRMLICNGSDVCKVIKNILPPIPEKDSEKSQDKKIETHYTSILGDCEVIVVMSGYVGRIDNYAKKRLGKEIDELLYNIQNVESV